MIIVYNREHYWAFGICPWSGILKETVFRKIDLLSSSRERMGATYSFATNRNSFSPFHLRMEIDSLSETLCSLEYRTMTRVQKVSKPKYRSLVLTTKKIYHASIMKFTRLTTSEKIVLLREPTETNK
jgi:hypothetical protein